MPFRDEAHAHLQDEAQTTHALAHPQAHAAHHHTHTAALRSPRYTPHPRTSLPQADHPRATGLRTTNPEPAGRARAGAAEPHGAVRAAMPTAAADARLSPRDADLTLAAIADTAALMVKCAAEFAAGFSVEDDVEFLCREDEDESDQAEADGAVVEVEADELDIAEARLSLPSSLAALAQPVVALSPELGCVAWTPEGPVELELRVSETAPSPSGPHAQRTPTATRVLEHDEQQQQQQQEDQDSAMDSLPVESRVSARSMRTLRRSRSPPAAAAAAAAPAEPNSRPARRSSDWEAGMDLAACAALMNLSYGACSNDDAPPAPPANLDMDWDMADAHAEADDVVLAPQKAAFGPVSPTSSSCTAALLSLGASVSRKRRCDASASSSCAKKPCTESAVSDDCDDETAAADTEQPDDTGSQNSRPRSVQRATSRWRHVCGRCGQDFVEKQLLMEHVNAEHLGLRPAFCTADGCMFTAVSKAAMAAHLETCDFMCRSPPFEETVSP